MTGPGGQHTPPLGPCAGGQQREQFANALVLIQLEYALFAGGLHRENGGVVRGR